MINGLIEAAEFLGCKIKPDDTHYKEITNSILNVIHTLNVQDRTEDCMFNTEYVPKHVGYVKPLLIDLKLPMGQQGASIIAA